MANRENISVSFTPQQARFLASCVTSGPYQSTSELVREAVRLLEHHHAHREAEAERARTLIQAGADQLDRGKSSMARPYSTSGTRSSTRQLAAELASKAGDDA